MNQGTLWILFFGGLLIACGGFASYMAAKQQMHAEEMEKQKPRRLRPSDARQRQLRR